MKIKTERNWDLLVNPVSEECVDITEMHDTWEEGDSCPHIVIPVEAIDEVVFQLLKAKKKFTK